MQRPASETRRFCLKENKDLVSMILVLAILVFASFIFFQNRRLEAEIIKLREENNAKTGELGAKIDTLRTITEQAPYRLNMLLKSEQK